MGWLNLLAIATALAMDAFAVAVATGLVVTRLTPRRIFRLVLRGILPPGVAQQSLVVKNTHKSTQKACVSIHFSFKSITFPFIF